MDKAERNIYSELQEKNVRMIVAITRAHERARRALSDGTIDREAILQDICDFLDPFSKKPF